MTAGPLQFRIALLRSSLHHDERGQISALGVLAAAAFACLLMLVVNTGYATSGKIEMQNAADATAISGATWVARGLNVISLNNVTETQLLAIILIIPALDQALDPTLTTLEIEAAGARSCSFRSQSPRASSSSICRSATSTAC